MKICLLSRFFDMRNAGIGRLSQEVYSGLLKRGHELTCMSVKTESHWDYLKYTAYDIAKNLPKNQDIYCALTPLEGAWLPRANSVTVFLDLIPLLHSKQAGARLNLNPVNRILGREYFRFMARMASHSERLVAISQQTKDDIIRCFGTKTEKITVIHPGVRQDLVPKPKPDNVFRIGYLGQLDHRKRVNLLIDAFIESGINGELVIAGAGIDEAKLKAQAQGHKNIIFQGFVPDDKLSDWFASIDILAHPSACEGFGLTLIEAMACKKPIRVWQDAIIPDEVKSRCYIANQSSVIAMMIADVMAATDYLIEPNYQFAKSLTWDSFVEKLESVFQEVLHG